jgi:hypothetical protein
MAGAQTNGIDAQRSAIDSALHSADVESLAQQQHESFTRLMNNPDLGVGARNSAPNAAPNELQKKLFKFGSELRYGKPNVVSEDGERIVMLIRSMSTATGGRRAPILAELVSLSNKGVPEAENFVGFAAEYGAFGATRDMRRALAFYRAAADQGYQPALYNLALASAYGRGGPADFAVATQYLERAASVAPESSNRICGIGSFLAYRQGKEEKGLQFAKDCRSALAIFPVERAEVTGPTPQRLESMRHAVATGSGDGYQLLAASTSRTAPGDRQFLGCKYALVNRYRQSAPRPEELRDLATRCVDDSLARAARGVGQAGVDAMVRSQGVAGVSGFVPAEIASLNRLRGSNHFHYGASVPYLPFAQQDADLFESVLATPSLPIARN